MADAAPAAGSFAFVEGAVTLREAGARLAALADLAERGLAARLGRLDALPAAANFDPFAWGLAADTAASTASGEESRAPRRRPARAATPGPAQAARTTSPLVQAVVQGALAGLAPGQAERAAGPSSAAGRGALAASARTAVPSASTVPTGRPESVLGLVAQATARARDALPAAATQPAALPALAVQAAGGLGQLVADLLARVDTGPGPAGSPTQAADAASPVQAMRELERRLGALAARSVASQSQRAAGDGGRAAAAPAAPRAPSRLLQGAVDPGPGPARALPAPAAAGTPGAAVPAAPGPAIAASSEEDVIAAINRRLVDQAWLRGVDLR